MIYYAFPFFDELDHLELRLRELWDVVDRFVLVESNQTFTKLPKPFHYEENKERFRWAWDKITALKCTDLPQCGDNWGRERHQRNHLGYGLLDCKPSDIVIITDADEIVRASAVEIPKHGEVLQYSMPHYYLFWNCLSDDAACIGKTMTYETFQVLGGPELAARKHPDRVIENGGWHFAYSGGPEAIQRKLRAFCHTEFDKFPFTNAAFITGSMVLLTDPLDRGTKIIRMPLDETFPRYLLQNQNLFADYIKGHQ